MSNTEFPDTRLRRFLLSRWSLVFFVLLAIILALAIDISLGFAQTPQWETERHKCVLEMERLARCTTACVEKTWPDIARCTNRRISPHIDPAALNSCINLVKAQRAVSRPPELSPQDPVVDAFKCAVS